MKRKALLQLFIVHNNSIKDFFRIMRISLFLLFVCVFQLMATDTEAQNAVINIRQNSLSIKQLIKEIEKQTDYLVVFRNQDVDVGKVVSFQQRFGTVSDYLNQVCENMGLGYVFENNYITLSPKVNAVNQDKKKITGKVTDQNGEAVIGASVVEKGTTNGIMTDIDGNFTLEVGDAAVVQISYIGYRTKEVSVTGKNHFLVQLLEDMQALDEVVVVGFGTQKKVNLTGAVSMVDSEVLESRPVQNVSQALQGVVPGLNFSVNKTGGELNNNLEMDIRGGGTIGEGSKSAPLVLIDGIEGDMNSINPNDIKSISVLKDASSSAIYGSRAAFGVVLITTKEGKAGRTNVNYSTNVRFSTPSALPTMMDSYQFAQFFNRAAMNQGGSPVFDETTMQRIIDYQAGKITSGSQVRPDGYYSENVLANANTDWFDKMYKKAVPSHEHNLSVSGGSDKITYLVSGSFMKQNGFINYNSDDFKRYTLNARIKADLSKYVTLVYGSKWIREDYDKPSYLGDLFYDSIARTWPTCPEYHDNGNYGSTMVYRLLYAGRNIDQKDQTYNQLQLTIEPIKDWKIYAEGNMRTINRMNHSELLPIPWINAAGEMAYGSLDGSRAAGATEVTEQSWRDNYLTGNLYSDYFKQFESGHYFKVMAGFNAELMKSRDVKGIMDNLITPDLPTLNTATENPRTSGGYSHWSTVGFFGRLNYNFQEKYLFEFNLRHDGTSRFLGDQRWGTFPSFSLGWNVAREGFFENLGNLKEYISTLKFRGSWGQLGNTNTEDLYPFYLTVPFKTQAGGWLIDGKKSNLSYAPGLVSTMLTWETVESWNVGLDWGAFNNRLTGSFEYYVRQTKDMVGPAPELPSILGTGVPKMNNADMKSYGFDLDVSWRDKVGDFSYGVKFVLSDNKRKVTRYPNENGIYSQWYAGKMSGELWGYETIGIAKTQEEMDKHLASLPNGGQTIGSQWAAGDIMYKDLNNDGKIDAGSSTLGDPGDKKIIGNSTPRYRFGLTLDGSWKGFDLSLFFQGVAKRDYLLAGPYFWGAKNGQWHSVGFDYHWDFFRPEGDPLGANVDSVTGLHGYYDPEALGDTGDKMGKVYPLSRTYSVGMNINF